MSTTMISICTGCVCELANGESSLTDDERNRHYATVELLARRRCTVYPDYDDHTWFSWSRCELCDGLPGDRQYATVVFDEVAQ